MNSLNVTSWICIGVAACVTGCTGSVSSFHDLSGHDAKRNMHYWPQDVDADDVTSVSRHVESAIDSYSNWYRIKLTDDAARKWIETAHRRQKTGSENAFSNLHHEMQGIQRDSNGLIPENWKTGATPQWWKPNTDHYDATESMLWYKKYNSGVGRATYTSLDESTGVLWIYEYASQHDILWEHDNPPTGKTFGRDHGDAG